MEVIERGPCPTLAGVPVAFLGGPRYNNSSNYHPGFYMGLPSKTT